jgi:hypothetical protein
LIASLDNLLLTLVLNHACAEAAGQLLRMDLECFCWSRWSNTSLGMLLLTLVLKHACAEARLCWSRCSIVSDESRLFLLKLLIDCFARQASAEVLLQSLLLELDRFCWRMLPDFFHWGLNVPVEAADRLLLLERCSIASLNELLLRPLVGCFARQASASAWAEARLYW